MMPAASSKAVPLVTTKPDGETLGALVLIHGLGDHARRHREVARIFAQAGIMVVAPELPGHGEAPGKRGHIAGIADIDAAIEAAVREVEQLAPAVPCGIAGHSMGALLVADHFARGVARDFAWVWLSSALVEPRHGKPKWLQFAGHVFSRICPRLTITNGVRPGDGWTGGADPDHVARERASGTHNRMSVGLGAELMRAGTRVSEAAPGLFGNTPVLMTHGDEDRVCPLSCAKNLFEALPSREKHLLVVTGARHEPWHDPSVAVQVRDWMVERLAG